MNKYITDKRNAEESRSLVFVGTLLVYLANIISGLKVTHNVACWTNFSRADGTSMMIPMMPTEKYPANDTVKTAKQARKAIKDLFTWMKEAQTNPIALDGVATPIKISKNGDLTGHKTMASAQKVDFHRPAGKAGNNEYAAWYGNLAHYKLSQFVGAFTIPRRILNPSARVQGEIKTAYSLDGVDMPLKTVRSKMLQAYSGNLPTITVNGVAVDISGTRNDAIAKAACLIAGYANGLFFDCATSEVTPSSVSVQNLTPAQISEALGVDISALKALLNQ